MRPRRLATVLAGTLVLSGIASAASSPSKPENRAVGALVRAHRAKLARFEVSSDVRAGTLKLVERARQLCQGGEFDKAARLLRRLPEKLRRHLDPKQDLDGGERQERAFARLRRAITRDVAAVAAGDRLAAFEATATEGLDRALVTARRKQQRALARLSPSQLRTEALRLVAALDYLTGGGHLRTEPTARGRVRKSVSASAAGSRSSSSFGLHLGTMGFGLGFGRATEAASGSYREVTKADYEALQLLPGARYRIRLRTPATVAARRSRPDDVTVLEARRIVEVALRLADVFAALDDRAPEVARSFAAWRRFSELELSVPRGRGEDVRRIRLAYPATDLAKLTDVGVVSPRLVRALDADVAQLLPAELR